MLPTRPISEAPDAPQRLFKVETTQPLQRIRQVGLLLHFYDKPQDPQYGIPTWRPHQPHWILERYRRSSAELCARVIMIGQYVSKLSNIGIGSRRVGGLDFGVKVPADGCLGTLWNAWIGTVTASNPTRQFVLSRRALASASMHRRGIFGETGLGGPIVVQSSRGIKGGDVTPPNLPSDHPPADRGYWRPLGAAT